MPPLRSDSGFTLIELLIGLVIGAALIWAAGAALVIGLRTTDEAREQVGDASWSQLIGSWFLTDVQDAEEVGVATCLMPAGGSLVESFTSSTGTGPLDVEHVTWWLDDTGVEGGNTVYELNRTECNSSFATTGSNVIGRELQGFDIACEVDPAEISPIDALQCTAAWTPDGDVPLSDWPFRLTATRRPG